MRELIETERIYVEELLSVLLVRKHTFPPCHTKITDRMVDLLINKLLLVTVRMHKPYVSFMVSQGYRAEMDNPALSGLLPPILRSKRDILFGNMPEIYNFHSRQAINDSHHTYTCLKYKDKYVCSSVQFL